jgi:hypothetical protein
MKKDTLSVRTRMPPLFRSASNRKHEEQRTLETMNRSRGDGDLTISNSAIIKAVVAVLSAWL